MKEHITLEKIYKLVKSTPNDMELGNLIREYLKTFSQ